MLPIRPTSGFKKDLKRAARQRRNIKKLHHVLEQLAIPAPLHRQVDYVSFESERPDSEDNNKNSVICACNPRQKKDIRSIL